MPVTAIEGIVENGRIRLREDISVPENTKVYVIVRDVQGVVFARIRTPRLANPRQAQDFRKQIINPQAILS